MGAIAILAALDYRRRTGKGQHIDLSQLEVGVSFLAPLLLDYAVNKKVLNRRGNQSDCAVPHNAYRCKGEDRWCVISVFTDKQWAAFCDVIEKPEWINDPKFASYKARKANEEELDRLIESRTVKFSAEGLALRLQRAGVPAGLVATGEDLFNDPQLEHRKFWRVLKHPEIGNYKVRSVPYKLSESPARIDRPAPCMGEHTENVCTELLKMADEKFVDLFISGVFD